MARRIDDSEYTGRKLECSRGTDQLPCPVPETRVQTNPTCGRPDRYKAMRNFSCSFSQTFLAGNSVEPRPRPRPETNGQRNARHRSRIAFPTRKCKRWRTDARASCLDPRPTDRHPILAFLPTPIGLTPAPAPCPSCTPLLTTQTRGAQGGGDGGGTELRVVLNEIFFLRLRGTISAKLTIVG